MEISANLVKELRNITDAGIMECKNALKECGGDIEKAVLFLKKRGLSKAAKKADRIAAEGVVLLKISPDFKKACIIEVNSETDFVAKNDSFQDFCSQVLNLCFDSELNDIEKLKTKNINGIEFNDYLSQKIATIGENIVVRRISCINANDNEVVNGYLHHNGKIGAISLFKFENSKNKDSVANFAKNISMHIASMKPKFLSYKELNTDFILKEKEGIIAEIKKENEELSRLEKNLRKIPEFVSQNEISQKLLDSKKKDIESDLISKGKPEKIWDKIISGQIERFILDNSILDQRFALLSQLYAMDDTKNVQKIIESKSAELNDNLDILKFVSFELGFGIEKKVDDFASEVAAQMK